MTALAVSRVSAPTLTVDLDAVAGNVRTIREAAGTEIMAVVKADAFGHGAVAVARTALKSGASSLGVTTIEEALALRRAGVVAPVLSWLNTIAADFETAIARGVDLAVPSVDHLAAITAASDRVGRAARVHLHVNTGMHRDGAPSTEWFALSAAARAAEWRGEARVVGAMGHLPCAELPGHPSTAAGRAEFLDAVDVMHEAGLRPTTLHLAATAAALAEPTTRFDLCRIGAGLYGIGPGLRPALTLTAPVVSVRDVAAGTAVGYGHAWVAPRATRLALVPLGYGDGIPRIAGGRGEVLVHGVRRPLAGTISMDQLVVDVGDLSVRPGDAVTIFAPEHDAPSIGEWSAWSHTIPHEIMTGLGPRIRREHEGAR